MQKSSLDLGILQQMWQCWLCLRACLCCGLCSCPWKCLSGDPVSAGSGLVPSSWLSSPDNWGERWGHTSLAPLVIGWELFQPFSKSEAEWRFPRTYWWVNEMQAHLPALGRRWWVRRSHETLGVSQNCFRKFPLREKIVSELSGLAVLPMIRVSL